MRLGRNVIVVACVAAFACTVDVVRPDRHPVRRAEGTEIAVQTLDASDAVEPILIERLVARGIKVINAAADSDRLTVSARYRGSQDTTLTRWLKMPWSLVSLVSLTLIPYRGAREAEVEVQLVNPHAVKDRRIRTARVSCETSAWTWLPLAFSSGSLSLNQLAAAQRATENECLSRAVDDALDQLLAP
jgi:hypothetical protein